MTSDSSEAQAVAPHSLTADDVLSALNSDSECGLTSEEASQRLRRFGPNRLKAAPQVPAWRKFLAQFTDILVLLLIAAALVSALLWLLDRDTALPYEAIAIAAIVILNAVMGYVQRARAEKAVQALRQMTAPQASVIRDGERQEIPALGLVPGDIIYIEEGDTIPADARIIETASLQTSEATLTGESLPVSKQTAPVAAESPLGDRSSMAFGGTAVSYGHGLAVVTATAMATEMGRIAGMLDSAPEESTPLQIELDRLGRTLGRIVIVIAAVTIGAVLLVGEIDGFSALFDVLILGVALAVAAVPEGLPAIVTAVLSIGVQRMAGKKAIVRHLAAVETLGSANVIASDKTGTLTKNEMTVRRIVTASGAAHLTGTGYSAEGKIRFEPEAGSLETLHAEVARALAAADRANNAVLQRHGDRWEAQGDPTEAALIVAARKAGLEEEALDQRFDRIGEVPFSSERKLMSTVHTDTERAERLRSFTKGAPDVLLSRCSNELIGKDVRPLGDGRRADILKDNEALADEALRTLGVAFRSLEPQDPPPAEFSPEVERDLVFLEQIRFSPGHIPPPRSSAGIPAG